MSSISESVIRNQLTRTLRETNFPGLGVRYQGKVRDTYSQGDQLILITTDRISAFDHILRQTIPFKGQVLNQLAAYFFTSTSDLVPNHLRAVPDPVVTIATRCEPVPVEFVVRGYLAGHAWREYQQGRRTVCGVRLPDDLLQNSRFAKPILTPATKAISGHDEDISLDGILARGILQAEDLDQLTSWALALFERGSRMASERGLILVDTKYEFGKSPDGQYMLIDEVHTPDSSRYFYADTYDELFEAGKPQRQLSKEFVREWLIAHQFMGLEGQALPDLSDDFILQVSKRYVELYEVLAGKVFEPDTHPNPHDRIEQVLVKAGLNI